MAAPVYDLPAIRHHADCACKPCMVDAFRAVVVEVVGELMPPPPEQALSITDAAAAAGVSDWTIRRLIDADDLPVLRVGKAVKVLRSDLEAWMRRRVEDPLPEVPRS